MTAQDISTDAKREAVVGDLFGEIQLSEAVAATGEQPRQSVLPGLTIVGTAGLAAAWLGENYGTPIVLAGLLIGLALSFISAEPKTHGGLQFASGFVLRIGIVLIGTQITFMQITQLGIWTFAAILAVIVTTIGSALIAARVLGQNSSFGLLCGGATAICGMSAALAIYSLIDKDKVSQTQFTVTLVGITVASSVALFAYPILAANIGLNDYQAGFLIGVSIHDVAQSISAGFSVSDEAGGTATIVKLTRVALLAPLVSVFAIFLASQAATTRSKTGWKQALKVPWFILGFLGMVAANSLFAFPPMVTEWGAIGAKTCLLLAVISVAMTAKLNLLLGQGLRIFVPIIAATTAAFLAALCLVWML